MGAGHPGPTKFNFMEKATTYAMLNMKSIQTDERFYLQDGKVYIEFKDGRNLQISEDEIRYQAVEYLEKEISYIKNKF